MTKAGKATPSETLREYIMDPRYSKTESEHWACRHIEALEREIEDLKAELAISRQCEVSDEIERLREIEKWRDQLFFDMTKDAKIINMLAEHLRLIANMSYEPASSVARAALEAAENLAKDKHA